MTPQPRDWRRVAEKARDEKDSNKMMALVIELDRLLENEEKSRRPQSQAATKKQTAFLSSSDQAPRHRSQA